MNPTSPLSLVTIYTTLLASFFVSQYFSLSSSFWICSKSYVLQKHSFHEDTKCMKLFSFLFFFFFFGGWKNFNSKVGKSLLLIWTHKNVLQTFYNFLCCRVWNKQELLAKVYMTYSIAHIQVKPESNPVLHDCVNAK